MNYLNQNYPQIEKKLPYIEIGNFPTPVKRLNNLNQISETCRLYCKCDDVSGSLYGGNKIRKLEFVFAEAKKARATRLITSGMVGSNHALATAIYGKKFGFNVTLMLFGEQKGDHVINNLIADYSTGADICYDETFEEHEQSIKEKFLYYSEKEGSEPFIIPAGGTSFTGVAGYMNAAFELKAQIEKGELDEPDAIFVPFGTMGTAAGLIIGMKLVGLKSKIYPVQVVPNFISDEIKFRKLINSSVFYFHDLDASFPDCRFSDEDYIIDKNQLGGGYGVSSESAEKAIRLFFDSENIKLDSVYSGKAAAGFIQYVKTNKNKNVLFWNTKSSVELPYKENVNVSYPEWFTDLLLKCKVTH